jgi:predicted Kef-type K+ transport protein
MIISISLALMVAGMLLFVLRGFDVPEIPLYLVSGLALSAFVGFGEAQGFLPESFVEPAIITELASLGLGILVFYTTSGMELDSRRKTSLDSFKSSTWLFAVSFGSVAGISSLLGIPAFGSFLLGLAASVGSTMLDFGIVKEETRAGHIYGRLTENTNFFTDLFAVVAFGGAISAFTGAGAVTGIMSSTALILAALLLRRPFGSVIMRVTDGESELLLLSGVMAFVCSAVASELLGVTALPGIYAAGILMVDTELGYRVRERFSSIKDFFTALAFFSIGFMFEVPPTRYLVAALAVGAVAVVLRPLLQILFTRIQGYDLRTGFMSSLQTSHVSEVALLSSLIAMPVAGDLVFNSVAFVFAVSVVFAELVEDNEQYLFERLFSSYELDPEKTDLPENPSGHVILAGYDEKTEGIEDMFDREVVVADFDLERIEEAEERGLYHLLADLESSEAWKTMNAREASLVVSGTGDGSVKNMVQEIEGPTKVTVDPDSDSVEQRLRSMLGSSIE